MSKLRAFLQPSIAGRTKEVFISDRFKDEDGKPVPFVVKAIDQKENEALAQLCRNTVEVDGVPLSD